MNENIERLAEEATEYMEFTDDTVLQTSLDDVEYEIPAEFIKIFAALIVQECAGIVNSLEQYEGQGDCSTAEYIKEHFGVE